MQLLLAVRSLGRELDLGGGSGRGKVSESLKVVSFLSFLSTLSLPALFHFLSFCSFSFRYADPVCSKERRHVV